MPASAEFLAVLIVPAAILTVLRINAAYVFLSLCLGDVLVRYVAKDPASFTAFISPHRESISTTTLDLIILLVPAVVTGVIMVFSVHGKTKLLLNLLPALGVSCLIMLLAVPLFTPGLRHAIQGEPMWQQISRLSSVVITFGAALSLYFLWNQRRLTRKFEKDRRHHL
jgi:hypothetical protein